MSTSARAVSAACVLLFLFSTQAWAPPPPVDPPAPGGTPPEAPPPATATVQVQCPGDSINAALETPAVDLTVEISGLCVEDVLVTRDRVILRGSDPNTDGIQAAETDATKAPFGAALFIRNARQITVENLLLTGGIDSGLHVLNSREGVAVTNCRMNNNGARGALLLDSFASMSDTEMLGNGLVGAHALRNAGLACTSCTIEGGDNNIAVVLQQDSNANLIDSLLTAGRLSCNNGSRASLINTSISSPVHAIGTGTSCEIIMNGGTLAGSIRASRQAQVLLFDVEQVSVETGGGGGPVSNSFNIGASLFAQDTMLKDVGFFSFANGTLGETTANASSIGAVSCNVGSDFFCLMDPGQVGPSTCGGCSICGDGALTPNEQCDDGNTSDGDGCDAACQVE